MRYELFIANRYLRSKRRTGFISLITYISVVGVMIGVAALVIVLSVANGFESEVRNRIIGADSHLKVTLFHEEPMEGYEDVKTTLKQFDHIEGASPYIQGKGMIMRNKSVEGVFIKGIDERTIAEVSDLPQIIVSGSIRLEPTAKALLEDMDVKSLLDNDIDPSHSNSLQKVDTPSLPGIVLGRQLSFRLGVVVGDSLFAISPSGMTGLFSTPEIKRLVVTGIFETGIFEYDDAFSYIGINAAQQLFEMGRAVTGVELKLDDYNLATMMKVKIDDELGYPYYTRTWRDQHRTLFRWMQLEKWLFTVILSLVILVAAFNIVSSQIMMVLEKRREIGILKAIGATRRGVMNIFLYEGVIIGIVGTVSGLFLGWLVCWAQQTYRFFSLPGDVYFLSELPVSMQPLDFIVISAVSLCLTLLATVYPARRAGALNPVDAIRYE